MKKTGNIHTINKAWMHVCILFSLICFTTVLFAQDKDAVSFTAVVNRTTLGANERLQLEFKMNKDGDNFKPPTFSDFTALGPSQSIRNSWINGKRSFSKSYTYVLQPKKQGVFTISPAHITIAGKTYSTKPITIRVNAAVNNPNAPKSAKDIAQDAVHLVAELSTATPYLNQAVRVVYKMYFNINISDYDIVKNPVYNDFWSQNIAIKNLERGQEQYKGSLYNYVVFKKVVLYPQKTGRLTLEPLALDLELEVPTGRRDIFGRQYVTQANKRVTAGARTLQVKPLPEQGKPKDFSGAVGDFTFALTTDKTTLNASESLQATLKVSGKGNLKLFSLPALKVPGALEMYDPEYQENLRTYLSGTKGSISNTYTIVPQYKGTYPIAPVSFSYFNPNTKKYHTINSKAIVLDVVGGPIQAPATNTTPALQAQTTTTKDAFAFIALKTQLSAIKDTPFYTHLLYIILAILPIVLFFVFYFWRKRHKKALQNTTAVFKKNNAKLAKKYLAEAKKQIADKTLFYVALEKALHRYLKAKLQIQTLELDKEKIQQLLEQKQVASTVITDFMTLLKNCEQARYAPLPAHAMQTDYSMAVSVISLLDKQL